MVEYLLGVGAMKAGTTLMYDHLRTHPQIRCGQKKELHYFDLTPDADKATYDHLFGQGGKEGTLKLDITPIYMFVPEFLDRITSILPVEDTAVLVLLRDPIERAISHHKMITAQALEHESLQTAFDLEATRMQQGPGELKRYSYFARGFYAKQLDELYKRFPAQRIKIMLFEQFIKDQQGAVNDVCEFVGLSPIAVKDTHSNKSVVHVRSNLLARAIRAISRYFPSFLKNDALRRLKYFLTGLNEDKRIKDGIDPAFREKLRAYYQADVDRLRTQYHLDLSCWKNFG